MIKPKKILALNFGGIGDEILFLAAGLFRGSGAGLWAAAVAAPVCRSGKEDVLPAALPADGGLLPVSRRGICGRRRQRGSLLAGDRVPGRAASGLRLLPGQGRRLGPGLQRYWRDGLQHLGALYFSNAENHPVHYEKAGVFLQLDGDFTGRGQPAPPASPPGGHNSRRQLPHRGQFPPHPD